MAMTASGHADLIAFSVSEANLKNGEKNFCQFFLSLVSGFFGIGESRTTHRSFIFKPNDTSICIRRLTSAVKFLVQFITLT